MLFKESSELLHTDELWFTEVWFVNFPRLQNTELCMHHSHLEISKYIQRLWHWESCKTMHVEGKKRGIEGFILSFLGDKATENVAHKFIESKWI